MMNQINLQTVTGWSALVNTVAGIVSFAALMMFFMRGGLWGPLNDAFSVIWALGLLPLVGWFFLLNRQSSSTLSAATAAIGIAAMLAFAALQFFLVVGLACCCLRLDLSWAASNTRWRRLATSLALSLE